MIELIAPAGDWPSLKAALDNGANGVYFGVTQLNMRDNARSFEVNELTKVAETVHARGARAYLTLNAIVFDEEIPMMERIVTAARDAGIDAIICWDISVISCARELGMRVHLSTQASVSNVRAVAHYARLGVSRIVLARECTLKQIRTIKEYIDKEGLAVSLEAFIHGALCISISGRCFMSEYLFGQSANRGKCLQPCRRRYHIIDTDNESELVVADGYVMSPKDICTLPFLETVLGAGVTACKIEGRMRPPEYVAAVTRVYRQAIDAVAQGVLNAEKKEAGMQELTTVYNRGFSSGFYFGMPANDLAAAGGSVARERKRYIGEVRKYYARIGVAEVMVRNDGLSLGQRILISGKRTGVFEQPVTEMQMDHVPITMSGRGDRVAIKVTAPVARGDKVFVVETAAS